MAAGEAEPLLRVHVHEAFKSLSQLAIVGSRVSPIESLDYEISENELLNQDWRSRGGRAEIVEYFVLKWTLCFLIGVLSGCTGFFVNLSVENIAGIKFVVTSNMMLANRKGRPYKLLLAACVSIFTSCCLFGLPWLATCRSCPGGISEACPTIGRSGNFKKFQCTIDHYNDLASLFFNTNDDTIRNLFSAGTDRAFSKYSILLFFVTSYFLGIVSYGLVAPSGLFVPVILTGATYGRLVGMLMGSNSTLDHGLFAVLGSASFLGGSMRMTVSVCVILLELTNNLLLLPLVMLVVLISKTVADCFTTNIYDMLVKLKGFPFLQGHVDPSMRQLRVSDVLTGPLQTFNGVETVGNIIHILKTTGHNGFPVIDEPPFSETPVLYGLILRSHLLVVLKKRIFLPSQLSAQTNSSVQQLTADDFAKHSSSSNDNIDDIVLTAEEKGMFIDLHPFANTSPYTVFESMSLEKAHILFHKVGLRHLLVISKSPFRAPVVGILTRHDFMPEHVLGLHPSLVRGRNKILQFRKSIDLNL